MRKSLLVAVILLGIFFLPRNVYAETIKICQDGSCPYTTIEEYYNTVNGEIPSDLTIDLGSGTYNFANDAYENLTIKGVSKEETILNLTHIGLLQELTLENLSINSTNGDYFGIRLFSYNITLNNVNVSHTYELNSVVSLRLDANNIIIKNVVLNNDLTSNSGVYALYIGDSNNINIDGLTINNTNSNTEYGLTLDNIENANINNLTINNSDVGLYIHRELKKNINSSVIVNNSNLTNTTCSSFNILDDDYLVVEPVSFINNKNYQVVFKDNNKLNCSVASGDDTNTYISSNNILSSPLKSYTFDEIDYDNLTNTIQNVNKGTVDVITKYKGAITIEQGSSSPIEDAFDNVDLNNNITWTSKDESISIIDINDMLGLKEGTTTITGVSSDGLSEYEIEVTVIRNPVTNSMVYIGIGLILILILGTSLYAVYRIKIIVNRD